MKKKTTRYIKINSAQEVKVELTLREDNITGRHEKPTERELTADEFEACAGLLATRQFSNVSEF